MLGVIGGSGLYNLPGLRDVRQVEPATPYGATSGPIICGRLGAVELCFLPRHGQGHLLNPTEVPYRANIHALKQLGISHLISISAVGSLREHLPPGALVLPDQVIDRTVSRERTFFEDGVVGHVSLADPFCAEFQRHVAAAATGIGIDVQLGGTYVCIEGPQFSTRAESELYRSWQGDIIGMTAMPEARLAREAGICYAVLATVTDYDVWHESEDDVTVEGVMQVLAANVDRGRQVIAALASRSLPGCDIGCANASAGAIATHIDAIPANRRELIALLTSRPSMAG